MSIPEASSLTTQGQISWDNLGRQTIAFSVDVLRRIAISGVDSYTLTVGQAICQHFRLATLGRKNVAETLACLRANRSWGDLLYFGFSIKSLPRLLGTTDQGITLLSLAAALSDAYGPDFGGGVLFHMVTSLNAPEEFTPSMGEWIKLVEACTGALAASELSTLTGRIIRQCEEVTQRRQSELRSESSDDIDFMEDCFGQADAEQLAVALLAMGEVSTHKIDSITIKGGLNVGWLAALGIWFFDLQVTIREDRTDNVVFSNTRNAGHVEPQICFILRTSADQDEPSALEPVSKSNYIASLKDVIRGESPLPAPGGRVIWRECLNSVFGQAFRDLQMKSHLLGTALGCAGAVFERAARDSGSLHHMTNGTQSYWNKCNFQSSGIRGDAFVQNTLMWFPELDNENIKGASARALLVADPIDKYAQAIEMLQSQCSCNYCPIRADQSKRYVRSFMPVCAPSVLETVIKISCLLARVESIHEGLFPTRRGIETLHERQLKERGTYTERLRACTAALGHAPHSRSAVEEACILFSDAQKTAHAALARSSNGVCVYLDALREVTLSSEKIFSIHILPGKIEKAGHIFYDIVEDPVALGLRSRNASNRSCVPEAGQTLRKHLRSTQTKDFLRVSYVFTNEPKPPIPSDSHDMVEPLAIQESMLRAMSRVLNANTHRDCKCSITSLGDKWQKLDNGDWRAEVNGQEIFVWAEESGRTAEEYLLLLARIPDRCYIRGRNCIGRAFDAAKLNSDSKGRPVFVLDT